jgi:hypothetical protein
LSAHKKALVRELISFTQAPEKVAIACLNAAQWNVEQAADFFYDQYMDTAAPGGNAAKYVSGWCGSQEQGTGA